MHVPSRAIRNAKPSVLTFGSFCLSALPVEVIVVIHIATNALYVQIVHIFIHNSSKPVHVPVFPGSSLDSFLRQLSINKT
jgi:hypothetical protein